MRTLLVPSLIAAVALGGLIACGGTVAGPNRETPPSGPDAASASNEADGGPSSADAGPLYVGTIQALTTVGDASPTASAYASFTQTPEGSGVTVSGCRCNPGIATPIPDFLSAGAITFQAPGGATLGALLPSPIASDGTYDLGANYSAPPAGLIPWQPGAVLDVSAAGYPGQVDPFSASFPTSQAFSGLTPAIGSNPVTVPLAQDLVVSWTPEGRSNESVHLDLSQSTMGGGIGRCVCDAADSDGRLILTASQIGATFKATTAAQTAATASFLRTIVTATTTANVALQLEGTVQVSSDLSFQ
jgi:hypothetical protein